MNKKFGLSYFDFEHKFGELKQFINGFAVFAHMSMKWRKDLHVELEEANILAPQHIIRGKWAHPRGH